MSTVIRVEDGSKAGSFDGFALEVFGLSGSASSKRLAIQVIDQVNVVEAGTELMFVVKSHKGGFGIVISQDKRTEWESLAKAVLDSLKQKT